MAQQPKGKSGWLLYEGPEWFRQKLVMSTLSGKPVRISNIRAADDEPGLKDFEASFLRLMDKLCNGTTVDINHTGTQVSYKPGLIHGGKVVHECPTSRAIGYFLEAIIALAPFSKKPFNLTLRGITNEELDPSVDVLRTVGLPLLNQFGIDQGLELKVEKRGAAPLGGGQVHFKCPIVKELKPIQDLDAGKVKRIRGIAYSTRVSPQTANRVVDSARSLLNNMLPDVYIYTDHYRGPEGGLSPGFGLSLVAETTKGTLYSADCVARPGELPEELGKRTARFLFEEVCRGGCVDTQHQALCLQLMVLCPEDVSKVRFGQLSPFTINYLRDLRDFFGVTFKITPEQETRTTFVSCLGVGFGNVSKKVG